MYSLCIALVLISVSIAFLTFAFRRIGAWGTGIRPRRWPIVLVLLGCYVIAIPIWWLAQPSFATDDSLGGTILFWVVVWGFTLPAFFLLGNRTIWGTAKRWLVFGVPVAIVGLVFAHVVEEFVLQTERPMGPDHPTIRGQHSVQACPNCGGEFVVTLHPVHGSDGTVRHDARFRKRGVCAHCFHTEDASEHRGEFYGVDHYLVNHLKPPERWRLVAFRNKTGRISFPWTGRIVGLPGEKIFIRDGAVWVNNERLSPPESVGPLRYTEVVNPELLKYQTPVRTHGYGHPDDPLTLAADEYFVLHDDPTSTTDCRLYGPYQWRDYLGVVEVIFWPPRRWQILR